MLPFILSTYSSSPHSTITLPHLFPSLDTSIDPLLATSPPVSLDSIPEFVNPQPLSDSDVPIPDSTPLSNSSSPDESSSPSCYLPLPALVPIPNTTSTTDFAAIPSTSSLPPLRKSTRVTKQPSYL